VKKLRLDQEAVDLRKGRPPDRDMQFRTENPETTSICPVVAQLVVALVS
jgi:hypothetical protein